MDGHFIGAFSVLSSFLGNQTYPDSEAAAVVCELVCPLGGGSFNRENDIS